MKSLALTMILLILCPMTAMAAQRVVIAESFGYQS
jgi:hypothetical protein